jgi:hypothetical protein
MVAMVASIYTFNYFRKCLKSSLIVFTTLSSKTFEYDSKNVSDMRPTRDISFDGLLSSFYCIINLALILKIATNDT